MNETEKFLDLLIEKTAPDYRKIPTDLKRNFLKSETLTKSQANWILNALKRTKALRDAYIPSQINEEVSYALGTNEEDDTKFLNVEDIIREELESAYRNILERLK